MAYNLKNEEDVKEFLKNLHIEYQFGCYSEKKANVCHLLGDYYEAVKQEMEKAAAIYKTTCDQYNYGRSCAKFGDFIAIGKGCKRDIPTAYKYMSKGCELNDEYGCLHAGVLGTSKNDVGEKDRATQIHTGVKQLKKACDMYNSDKACFYLSGIYLGGLEGIIDKNYKEAYKLSLKSCELGNPYACANLSQMHARGDGVQKNPELAETFKKRANDLYQELKQSNAQLVDDKSDRTNVSVDVYYESLCSDSMRWIVNQLVPSYSELKNHLHITLIPYGKATHARESETGPWQFFCQHGSDECRGNKAQACAIHSIQTSEEAQEQQQLTVKLVGCAMSAGNPSTAVPQCAQDIGLSEGTRKLINECIESSFGDDLLAANGNKTHNLQPPLRFVPTIIINGVYSKENQDTALNNFSKLICHYLTEQEKPSICSSVN